MSRGRRDHGIRIVPVRRFPPRMSLGRDMAWFEQQRLMLVLIQGREHQSAIRSTKGEDVAAYHACNSWRQEIVQNYGNRSGSLKQCSDSNGRKI